MMWIFFLLLSDFYEDFFLFYRMIISHKQPPVLPGQSHAVFVERYEAPTYICVSSWGDPHHERVDDQYVYTINYLTIVKGD